MSSSRQRISCLLLTGHSLSDNACDDLLLTCCSMARSHKSEFDLKTHELEGRIETAWVESRIGSISGYEFVAELDTEKGKTSLRFLIRFSDLKRIEDLDLERVALGRWEPWEERYNSVGQ